MIDVRIIDVFDNSVVYSEYDCYDQTLYANTRVG